VTFSCGDQTYSLTAEVLPGEVVQGEIVVEPGEAVLSPGQGVPLRVYVLAKNGRRYDRTDSAVLKSSDPAAAMIAGDSAVAVAPGIATVTATVPGVDGVGRSKISVSADVIEGIYVEPGALGLAVGEQQRLRVFGRGQHGTYELLPAAGLKLTVGGAKPGAVRVSPSGMVTGVTPGQTEITCRWNDFARTVPITVSADALADLRLEPKATTVQPGDRVIYQATVSRGGRRFAVGPDDGLTLAVEQPSVAQLAGGLAVRASAVGHTTVKAQFRGLNAAATLDVVPESQTLVIRDRRGRAIVRERGGYRVILPDDATVVYDLDRTTIPDSEIRVVTEAAGRRFQAVNAFLQAGAQDFRVKLDVTAAASEGPLEYRVYRAGQTPPAAWQAAELAGDFRRATLFSPPIPYGTPADQYRLIIEARDRDGRVQQCPFTFRLTPQLERTGGP